MIANLDEMQQQTPEWLEMRRSKIGASDASAIMGISPWKSAYELWLDKMGLTETTYRSPAMQRGIDLEQEAREEFENLTTIKFFPKVLVNPDIPWQMASVDGISEDGKTIVEIKCAGKLDHAIALNNLVPEKYMPQLQHQMCVCNVDSMYYFSYLGQNENNAIVYVYRDDEYIEKLLEKEQEFWQCMQTFTPPPLTERDYTKRTDLEWKNTAYEWQTVQKSLREYEKRESELRQRLIDLSNGKNSCGSGLKVTKMIRDGGIDYKKIPYEKDVEKYRKPVIEYWKISADKS
jgi:putative phage-type endonuclease